MAKEHLEAMFAITRNLSYNDIKLLNRNAKMEQLKNRTKQRK